MGPTISSCRARALLCGVAISSGTILLGCSANGPTNVEVGAATPTSVGASDECNAAGSEETATGAESQVPPGEERRVADQTRLACEGANTPAPATQVEECERLLYSNPTPPGIPSPREVNLYYSCMSAAVPAVVSATQDSFYDVDEAAAIVGEVPRTLTAAVDVTPSTALPSPSTTLPPLSTALDQETSPTQLIDQTLRMQLDGPTQEESGSGLTSAFPANSSALLSAVSVSGDVAVVELSDDVKSITGFGLPGYNRRALAELGLAVLQFPQIRSVEFRLADGCAALGELLEIGQCIVLTRADFNSLEG